MSKGYGWQCESAILPSKSNPINNVDSKSILALKAIISKPSHLNRSKKNEDDIYPSAKKTKIEFHPMKKKIENSKKPTKYQDEQSEKESKVLQSLTAKAKLYEEMSNRKDSLSSVPSGGLIDFKRKNEDVLYDQEELEEISFVIDRGGSNQQDIKLDRDGEDQQHIDFAEEHRQQKALSQLIEDRLHSQSNSELQSQLGHVSRGAKVKSRWDVTLQSSSKAFLDEIHHQTEQQRQQTKTTTTREERMEMLRDKQRQLQQEQL